MNGIDSMPAASYKRKADPRHAQKIREGGKKADLIKHQMERHHKAVEEPKAEHELKSALATFYDEN